MLARDASEKLFQDKVVQIAKMNGWLVAHQVPHQVRPGEWRSDTTGFPDLVLMHPTRGIIFAELKTEVGKLTTEQTTWLRGLSHFAECYVWRPTDLQEIAGRLGTASVYTTAIGAAVKAVRNN